MTHGKDSAIYAAFQIFKVSFKPSRSFLETRQPEVVVFSTKRRGLSEIHDTYLTREAERLEQLGYALDNIQRVPPFSEYVLRRLRPSQWSQTGD